MLGFVLGVVFTLGWILLYVYRVEATQEALPHYAASERRWVLLTPAVVAIHMTLACVLVTFADPPPWRAATGVAVFAAAVGFWCWARGQIGPWRVTRLPDEPPLLFRRDGAFGIVRHPLFFCYLAAAAAPAIVAARPILLVTLAACFAALAVRAGQEERRLHQQLGPPYAAYCRTVKRLIPFVW